MLQPGEQNTTKADYTSSVSVTQLAGKIKDTAMGVIDGAKVIRQVQRISNDGKDNKLISYDISNQLPENATEIIVAAIAYAVAVEVVAEIKANLQLTAGSATFVGQTAAGTWTGAGGGVPGPVTIFSGAGIAGSETLNITPGSFL